MTDRGACILELVDVGLPTERAVVREAGAYVMASREVVASFRAKDGVHTRIEGDRVTFGTPGEGVGEVTYEIGPDVRDDEVTLVSRGLELPTIPLTRVWPESEETA